MTATLQEPLTAKAVIQKYVKALQGLSAATGGNDFILTVQSMNTKPEELREYLVANNWITRDGKSGWVASPVYTGGGYKGAEFLTIENGKVLITTKGQIMLSILMGKVINVGDPDTDPQYFTDGISVWRFTPGEPPMTRRLGDSEWDTSIFTSLEEFRESSPNVTGMHPDDGECDFD